MASTDAGSGRPPPCSVIREPFFSDRVCTVMFSGPMASTRSRVRPKPSKLSAGRPAIRSMFTSPPNRFPARAIASPIWAAVWARPMAWRT